MVEIATYRGGPCGRCGGTLRYRSDRSCIPCSSVRSKRWRGDNVEYNRARNKAHHQKNHEYQLARLRRNRIRRRNDGDENDEGTEGCAG